MNEQLNKLFELCPYNLLSEFERENFYAQTGVSSVRYIIEVINRIRKIDSDLLTETKPFETNCLKEEKNKLEKFLLDQDVSDLEVKVANWEMLEREHWAEYLGKIAAIELLTFGKASIDTMTKMVKLPEDLYIKSTQICVTLANKIKEATVKAEQEIGIGMEEDEEYANSGLPTTNETAPTTLVLKKIK
jgi:hypothetical protein